MISPRVGIFKFPFSNSRSVFYAIQNLDFDCRIVESQEDFKGLSHLILPGVGSYLKAMEHLKSLSLLERLSDFRESGKSILGICLGMQVLSQYGEEGGYSLGLGFIEGSVKKIPQNAPFRVPHVGWNSVSISCEHEIFNGIQSGLDFYFSHSYFFDASADRTLAFIQTPQVILPCVVGKQNVLGVQFHPEKSHKSGLRLLKNFCGWNL